MIKIEISTPCAILAAPTATFASNASAEEVNELFGRLRQLTNQCRVVANKNDCLNILIAACIDEGVNTGRRIVGVATRLGFDATHARISLNKGIGDWWARDKNGAYQNLN